MKPISSLLVPLDLSDEAERALGPAMALAEQARVPVVLFSWSFDEGEAATAKRYLGSLAASLGDWVLVEVSATDDHTAAPAIARAAARHGATVFMSTHGRGGLGQALLGSVAAQTLGLLRDPTVLVGPHAGDTPGPGSNALVTCFDGSAFSERALPVARVLADQLDLTLHLVESIDFPLIPPPGDAPPDLVESGYLHRLASTLPGDEAVFEVLHGAAADAVVDYSTPRARLIVMSTHGRGGFARTLLGSVTTDVVRHARCPVVVVPPRFGT